MDFRESTLEGVVGRMFSNFYHDRRVLVTGHSGFKGGWLSLWLKKLGASVWGLGLAAPTNPNLHQILRQVAYEREVECDVRDLEKLRSALRDAAPEIVFHLAALIAIPYSYQAPASFVQTNVHGTLNVLQAARAYGVGRVVHT